MPDFNTTHQKLILKELHQPNEGMVSTKTDFPSRLSLLLMWLYVSPCLCRLWHSIGRRPSCPYQWRWQQHF